MASGLLVLSAAIVMLKNNQQAATDLLPVELHTLQIGNGWGYEVMVDKKVYIHQDCIPAIASFKPFNTEAEAALIGRRVIEKMKKGIKPAMSVQEINEAGIHY